VTSPKLVRLVSIVEGLSLLALLGIAMPLKYGLDMPAAVRVTGMAHGLLFLVLLLVLLVALIEKTLPVRVLVAVGVLSVVPFGFFVADRMINAAGSTT
jgi:integral membrane protein